MYSFKTVINRFIEEQSVWLEKTSLLFSRSFLRDMLRFCAKPYQEITTRDIQTWLQFLEEKGVNRSLIDTRMWGVYLFYQYCLEEDLMDHNPVKSIHFLESDLFISKGAKLSYIREEMDGNDYYEPWRYYTKVPMHVLYRQYQNFIGDVE